MVNDRALSLSPAGGIFFGVHPTPDRHEYKRNRLGRFDSLAIVAKTFEHAEGGKEMMKARPALLLIGLILAGGALAQPASVTETSGTIVNVDSPAGPFDRLWTDADGIQHARG